MFELSQNPFSHFSKLFLVWIYYQYFRPISPKNINATSSCNWSWRWYLPSRILKSLDSFCFKISRRHSTSQSKWLSANWHYHRYSDRLRSSPNRFLVCSWSPQTDTKTGYITIIEAISLRSVIFGKNFNFPNITTKFEVENISVKLFSTLGAFPWSFRISTKS